MWFYIPLGISVVLWAVSLLLRTLGWILVREKIEKTPAAGTRVFSAVLQWLLAVIVFALAYRITPAALPFGELPSAGIIPWVLGITLVVWTATNVVYLAMFRLGAKKFGKVAVSIIVLAVLANLLPGALTKLGVAELLKNSPHLGRIAIFTVSSLMVTLAVSFLSIRLASASEPASLVSYRRYSSTVTAALLLGLALVVSFQVTRLQDKSLLHIHLILRSKDPVWLVAGIEDSDESTQTAAIRQLFRQEREAGTWNPEDQELVRRVSLRYIDEHYHAGLETTASSETMSKVTRSRSKTPIQFTSSEILSICVFSIEAPDLGCKYRHKTKSCSTFAEQLLKTHNLNVTDLKTSGLFVPAFF